MSFSCKEPSNTNDSEPGKDNHAINLTCRNDPTAIFEIILIRHGESTWNAANRFTGWYDCPLTEKGQQQAQTAGNIIKRWKNSEASQPMFDVAFTSYQNRAIKTLWIILEELDLMYLPIRNAWQLNERHYGGLEGQNKHDARLKYGCDQVTAWRRSFETVPPICLEDSPYHAKHDPRYWNVPFACEVAGESLKMTFERVILYWEEVIKPEILSKKRILICAHGNSLRALVKYIDHISDEEIPSVNIPMGVPLVYQFDQNLNVIPFSDAIAPLKGKFLGNREEIKKSILKVKNQTK